MKYVRGIRWYMVTLVTLALIVNYLARNTLSVAAPTMMKELDMSTQQYSYIVVAWQICYAVMQPVAGYVLDAVGTKIGFGIFALAWSLVCAAAALATGWQSLAFFRALLGMTEAAGIPGGVKASTEWFPAKERSVAIGWFNIGSSIGALCAPPLVVWTILHGGWKMSFVVVGVLGVLWFFLWMLFYKSPRDQKLLSPEERDYILDGQEKTPEKVVRESWTKIVRSQNFWSIAIPRFLSEPAWQTFNAWIPL
jgi:ACS family hexuronate transporter-like MFS transporter